MAFLWMPPYYAGGIFIFFAIFNNGIGEIRPIDKRVCWPEKLNLLSIDTKTINLIKNS